MYALTGASRCKYMKASVQTDKDELDHPRLRSTGHSMLILHVVAGSLYIMGLAMAEQATYSRTIYTVVLVLLYIICDVWISR